MRCKYMEGNLPVGVGISVLFVNLRCHLLYHSHIILSVLVGLLQVSRAGCCWSYLFGLIQGMLSLLLIIFGFTWTTRWLYHPCKGAGMLTCIIASLIAAKSSNADSVSASFYSLECLVWHFKCLLKRTNFCFLLQCHVHVSQLSYYCHQISISL